MLGWCLAIDLLSCAIFPHWVISAFTFCVSLESCSKYEISVIDGGEEEDPNKKKELQWMAFVWPQNGYLYRTWATWIYYIFLIPGDYLYTFVFLLLSADLYPVLHLPFWYFFFVLFFSLSPIPLFFIPVYFCCPPCPSFLVSEVLCQ